MGLDAAAAHNEAVTTFVEAVTKNLRDLDDLGKALQEAKDSQRILALKQAEAAEAPPSMERVRLQPEERQHSASDPEIEDLSFASRRSLKRRARYSPHCVDLAPVKPLSGFQGACFSA